jgi:hypothetical protein
MLIAADDHGALESFRDREHARLVAFGALAGVGRAEGFKRIGDL